MVVPFSANSRKTFFDRSAVTVNSRCGTERIFRLFLMGAFEASKPSFRGKNPHYMAAARVPAQHQLCQVLL
jgi:hypothetical protein